MDLTGQRGWTWYERGLCIWGQALWKGLVVTPAELTSLCQGTGCGTLARPGRLGRMMEGRGRQTQ